MYNNKTRQKKPASEAPPGDDYFNHLKGGKISHPADYNIHHSEDASWGKQSCIFWGQKGLS